jgi:hypothetical protein
MNREREEKLLEEVVRMDLRIRKDHPKLRPSMYIVYAAIAAVGRLFLRPKVVSQSGRTIYVRWNDGTITQSTAAGKDPFDPKIGFGMCLMKHLYYGKKGREYLKFILENIQVEPKKRSKQK